ncbi:neuroendocrine convertase 2-like [Mercenaria mercenaria]|uniref:neuroendocrine convertase 2-like n=1 Tax=Mercenaria mercenaria TaxID=6596 RepID=UPI00234F5C2B|nr:neuroendocrine convertase 2-like [Mercenaria mercenaria]
MMACLNHVLRILALCALTSICYAEENSAKTKHVLTKGEKLKKAKALNNTRELTKTQYSGKFIMHYSGTKDSAVKLGEKHGFEFVKKICNGYFKFKDTKTPSRSVVKVEHMMKNSDNKLKNFTEETLAHPKALSVTPEPLLSFNVTDAYWSRQWHLQPSKTPSMGVYEAWERGYTGNGVVMAIVDDGMDTEHTDLVDNYDATLSHNFVHDSSGGIHIEEDDGHGTKCAGLAAAAKNDACVIGVAYEATLASLRILDEYFTVSVGADALTHNLDTIDIYSNSWGYPGKGYGFEPLYDVEEAALIQGIREGRNGRGAIYLFAAGNDGQNYDDCNAAGHVNTIYTISVNALKSDGTLARYSEECTSIMVATYGGDTGTNTDGLIATTKKNDTCTDDFLGTSAACPIAAGIVALSLQANPDLTWRDVQHLIAETSAYDGVPGELYQTNGRGKNVSVSHGFGVMNADRMVVAAVTWSTVPEKIACVGETQSVYKCCAESIEASHDVQNCHIKYLEHVQVHVSFQAVWREYIELHLVSPQCTDSRILRQRRADFYTSRVDWTFMTVFNWGEDPTGNWTIRMDDFIACDNVIHLYTWTLTLHGTITDPQAGVPENGTLGGHCDANVNCHGGMDCLLNYNLCVHCNISDYRVVNGYCAKDRKTDGYCDVNNICEDDQSWCNANNYCEACETGLRRYDDNCYEDGKLGGYCDLSTFCTGPNVGCNWLLGRCVNCSNGYRVVSGYCTEDGTISGYCDTEIACNTESNQ